MLNMFSIGSEGPSGPGAPYPPLTGILRLLRPLPKWKPRLKPEETVSIYTRLALQLHEAGLGATGNVVLEAAKEGVKNIENPDWAAQKMLELGEAHYRVQHWDLAQDSYIAAAELIARCEAHRQPDLYARLAIAQKKMSEPWAKESFAKAGLALGKIPKESRSSYMDALASRLVEAGYLSEARQMINQMPPNHGVYALSHLGKSFALAAETDFSQLTLAQTTFQEAQTRILRGKGDRSTVCTTDYYAKLANAMLASGPGFQDQALSLIGEYREFINTQFPDTQQRAFQYVELISVLAKARQFFRATRILSHEFINPDLRSQGYKNLAILMAEAGRVEDALAVMESEPLQPFHRFQAMLRIANYLSRDPLHSAKKIQELLDAAEEIVSNNVFYPSGIGRPTAYLLLANQMAKSPHSLKMLERIFRKAKQALRFEMANSNSPFSEAAEVALQEFGYLAAPQLKGESLELFDRLHAAAQIRDLREIANLATVLGFRTDGFELQEKLFSLPQELRGITKAWLYYGASLLPRPEGIQGELITSLRDALRGCYLSEGPHSAKIHLILIQALKNLSPNLLNITLHEEVRNRLDAVKVHWTPFSYRESWLQLVSFSDRDRLLLQGLTHLARHGSVLHQAFIAELMNAPAFPAWWKPSLQRILRHRGYNYQPPAKILH